MISIREIGRSVVSDEFHRKHFGHHERFGAPRPGRRWLYREIEVRMPLIRCYYPQIGDSSTCSGVMAAVGYERASWAGKRLVDMASLIRASLEQQTVPANASLDKVLALRVAGTEQIYRAEEPIMLCPDQTVVWLIEGNHRVLALALLGEQAVRGIDWSALRPVDESGT